MLHQALGGGRKNTVTLKVPGLRNANITAKRIPGKRLVPYMDVFEFLGEDHPDIFYAKVTY